MSWLDDLSAAGADAHVTSAGEIGARAGSGEWSAVNVARSQLERIRLLSDKYKFFGFVDEEEALAAAAEIDRVEHQGGEPGPFWGVADARKDFLPTKGKVTTPGSAALRDWVPTEDSPVVERLRQAGGILLGNTTTSELAHAARATGARSARLPVARVPTPMVEAPRLNSHGAATRL